MTTLPGDSVFSFVYKLDSQPGPHFPGAVSLYLSWAAPVAHGVRITDTQQGQSDDTTVLDFNGDRFSSSHFLVGGEYRFITVAQFVRAPPFDYKGFVALKDGDYYFFTDQYVGQPGVLMPLSGAQAICFMAGTAITTPDGTANIEDLAIGDLVLTSEGRAMPVRWIGRQTVSTLFTDETRLPVRVAAGALGDEVPCRDLLVSNDHALLIEGVLVQAGALINGVTITRERGAPKVFTYYHVELDDHSLILAENVPAETFVDNVERTAFDNWAEYQALYPNGRSVPEMDLPRVKAQRQLPGTVRRLIASRLPVAGRTEAA